MSSLWTQINQSADDAVQRVQRSVVQLRSDEEGSIGAGTIWHSDGLIVTNAHVVLDGRGPRRLSAVLSDGRRFTAHLLSADPARDLATLHIDASELPTITPGRSSQLRAGEWLMALGHPWGVVEALTAGIVVGVGSNLPEQADGREWIALDMQMRPGHSGGPLFNHAGEILGINTMIRGPELSFAIPVDVVKRFLQETIGAQRPAQAASYRPTASASAHV